jgi:hypothetical protein
VTAGSIGGRVLDPTAMMAIITRSSPYAAALLDVCNDLNIALALPTTALQATMAAARPEDRRWLLELADAGICVVVDLDREGAWSAGLLAARAGLPSAHLAAAQAAQIGISRGWPVVTTSPNILLALSSDVRTETIP